MSFPTLQVRPNEKNPKVLRAHEFLRQSNQLVERNLINMEGRKMLARMLTKMVAEVKCIYALDEKRAEAGKSGKLMEKLKSAHQISMAIMEDRFVNADLARQVQEKKMEVQRKYTEIDNLRKSVQVTKAEVAREIEKNEKRRNLGLKANEELAIRSSAVLKSLENSADVGKLRKMEEEKRRMEEQVDGLRQEKQRLADEIRTKRATLKAESKKSFQKTVVECAKHYKLHKTLAPKLVTSQRNVETLKEEEEQRRASGSLDETIIFDRSFVLASMEKEKSPAKLVPPRIIVQHQEPMETDDAPDEVSAETPAEITSEHAGIAENEVEMSEEPVAQEAAPISMETQRVMAAPEEPEEEELEQEKNDSMDVIEEEEEPPAEPVFDALRAADQLKTAENAATALLKDVASRLEQQEQEEVLSEHGSNRDDNFSFNFFGNKETGGGGGDEEPNSDANFDFNFGTSVGSGDDASHDGSTGGNGGGGFDFLGNEATTTTTTAASDPFGFGKSSGGGGGDMSFNFNFDAANGDNENGGGNSTFFNF